jgi:hypothetical protein
MIGILKRISYESVSKLLQMDQLPCVTGEILLQSMKSVILLAHVKKCHGQVHHHIQE